MGCAKTHASVMAHSHPFVRGHQPHKARSRSAQIGGNLSHRIADELRAVEHRLNNRPRKSLGWRTPARASAATLPS
jgi:IS30 family transposase